MGCVSSKKAVGEHKAALASAEFQGALSWSGLASITGTLAAEKAGNKLTSEVKDSSGAVLLKAELLMPKNCIYRGGETTVITDAATGGTVVQIINTQWGDFFTNKPHLWSVTQGDGKQLGTFKAAPNGTNLPMEYLDANGAVVLSVKKFADPIGTQKNLLLNGPDGTAAAVVEGLFAVQWHAHRVLHFRKGCRPDHGDRLGDGVQGEKGS